MIKCIDCKFNILARNLGNNVRLCNIPLPVGIRRENRIHDEKKQGCALGETKKEIETE